MLVRVFKYVIDQHFDDHSDCLYIHLPVLFANSREKLKSLGFADESPITTGAILQAQFSPRDREVTQYVGFCVDEVPMNDSDELRHFVALAFSGGLSAALEFISGNKIKTNTEDIWSRVHAAISEFHALRTPITVELLSETFQLKKEGAVSPPSESWSFFFYFRSERDAIMMGELLRRQAFVVEVEESGNRNDDHAWECIATSSEFDESSLAQIESWFVRLAAEHYGEDDGWSNSKRNL